MKKDLSKELSRYFSELGKRGGSSTSTKKKRSSADNLKKWREERRKFTRAHSGNGNTE